MMDNTMLMLIAEAMEALEEVAMYEAYEEVPTKYVKLAQKLAEEESEFYGG